MKTRRRRQQLQHLAVCCLLAPSASAFQQQHRRRIRSTTSKIFEKPEKKELRSYSAQFLEDNGLDIVTEKDGRVTARKRTDEDSQQQQQQQRVKPTIQEQSAKVVPLSGFNVVLTHCTADFDSLASAVGLAKLWANHEHDSQSYDSSSNVPTFVVLPRGAHPGVQRFLALHKHLFPIRSLRSLPTDLSGLNRLGLVDAQRRDRVGPAEHLIGMAKRVTVVDHHIDSESDIPEATDYVVDEVGSVSTLIVERLAEANIDLTEAEATLLALGIHADTGSLCYDSTTARDAKALAWIMEQGASQAAIAEHAQSSLSPEQQGVLTQALINTNSTVVHGVTVSTVLLSADGFINGLAAVTQDALELSSSDVFLLALVYEARSGGRSKKGQGEWMKSRLFTEKRTRATTFALTAVMQAEAWKGGEEALLRRRLRAAFDRRDSDQSGFLEKSEVAAALATAGVIASEVR
jgi:nanoRNase/pAp phosphatase (c-di-AMP/oligoRNAs hydrolase)